MKITTVDNYTEIEVMGKAYVEDFNTFADSLVQKLNISFFEKLSTSETCYWDFYYYDIKLTLHYRYDIGITIYPYNLKKATAEENNAVTQLYQQLTTYS